MGDDEPPTRWLLVSDADDTLLGDDEALSAFRDAARRSPDLLIAVNSSRPAPSVLRSLADLPFEFQPHALITAMGTQIQLEGVPDESWSRSFTSWNRDAIDRSLAALGFQPHPDEMQAPFKVSYAVPGRDAARRASDAVCRTGVEARIVISGQSDFDVIPAAAGKAQAMLHLAKRLCIGLDRLIVAGDSANDLDMFRAARKGVVVANARAELRDQVDPSTCFFAQRPRAAGVLEGLLHYQVPIQNMQKDLQ